MSKSRWSVPKYRFGDGWNRWSTCSSGTSPPPMAFSRPCWAERPIFTSGQLSSPFTAIDTTSNSLDTVSCRVSGSSLSGNSWYRRSDGTRRASR